MQSARHDPLEVCPIVLLHISCFICLGTFPILLWFTLFQHAALNSGILASCLPPPLPLLSLTPLPPEPVFCCTVGTLDSSFAVESVFVHVPVSVCATTRDDSSSCLTPSTWTLVLYRMSYRRQKRWWNAYILFYERLDVVDSNRKIDLDKRKLLSDHPRLSLNIQLLYT